MTLKNPRGICSWTKPGYASAKRAWGEFTARARPALGELEWVRMFEIQHWRGVPHVHALVGNTDPSVRRLDLVDWAWGRWGIARVEEYNKELGARFYLTKYVTKRIADIEFSRNLGRDHSKHNESLVGKIAPLTMKERTIRGRRWAA